MGDWEKQSRQMAIREELNQHKLYLISEQRKGRIHCHARLTIEMLNLPEEFKQTTGYCSKLGASRDGKNAPSLGSHLEIRCTGGRYLKQCSK